MTAPAETEVDPKRASELAEAGEADLIDVRTDEEFAKAHIPGARHIELNDVAARAEEIERERPVILYCESGSRSAMARDALREAGWDARVLEGGIEAWSAAGLPTEPGVE